MQTKSEEKPSAYEFIGISKDKKGQQILRYRFNYVSRSKYKPHQGEQEKARRRLQNGK